VVEKWRPNNARGRWSSVTKTKVRGIKENNNATTGSMTHAPNA